MRRSPCWKHWVGPSTRTWLPSPAPSSPPARAAGHPAELEVRTPEERGTSVGVAPDQPGGVGERSSALVLEAVHTYLNLVSGLSRVTLGTARAAARGVLSQVGLEGVADEAERRVGAVSEEIISAGRANRQLLENLVAGEVTKVASRWGFVRSDDLDEVREEVAELRHQLRRQQAEGRQGEGVATPLVPGPTADAGA